MITITFVDLAQLFLLTTISFGVNGWLALELYRDYVHRKALKGIKWVLDPATAGKLGIDPATGAQTTSNVPHGVYPTGRYM